MNPLEAAEPLPWDDFLAQMQQSEFSFTPLTANSPQPLKNNLYRSKNESPVAVVFTPGMGEPALKYYELASAFAPLNATLYFWDHIGQGFSTHQLTDDRGKTHIDNFDTHVNSLKEFLKSIRSRHQKIFFVGHSMGGHIGLRLLREFPELIDKAVVSSPMVDIRRYYLPIPALRTLLSFLNPTNYMWGAPVKKSGHTVLLTHSEERKKNYQRILEKYPEVLRRWVTVQWVSESLASIQKLNSPQARPIEKPILMLTAEHEVLVSPTAQEEFCSQQKKCKRHQIKDAYHELFVEEDPLRQEALRLTLDFLKN